MDYDVVIAGASIAGCSAAIAFGRAGLRVGVFERSRDATAFKAMCGHYILGGAAPTLGRLDLWQPMLDAGAEVSSPQVWSGETWIDRADAAVPPAISLRREVLDPLLRRVAAATPGVEIELGARVTGVLRNEHRVCGVELVSTEGMRWVTASLVVGADGHRSPVAKAAGLEETTAPNPHFLWWAYYEGVSRAVGKAQIWPADPDGAVVVPAGNGLTLVGAFPSKPRLGAFADNRIAAIERYVAACPDAPDLRGAQRVSAAVGTSDYPFVKREPTAPGLALIGDAAMAADPVPAVGCGWAFRSAEWLAESTIPALRDGGDGSAVDAALLSYRAARVIAEEYDDLSTNVPTADAVEMQRRIRRAAAYDPEIARRLGMFAMRAAPVSVLRNPDTVERAMRALEVA